MVLNARDLVPKIIGWHMFAATLTGMPFLQMQPAEAELMAGALVDVSKHYDLNLMSGPKAALFNLAAVCGMIYVPRIIAVRDMKRAAKAAVVQPSTPDGDIFAAPAGGIDLSGLNSVN